MIFAGGGDWNGLAHAVAAIKIPHTRAMARTLVKLQHRHEGLLRNLHEAHSFHPSLAFLLLLQQFAFPRNVAAITFRQHVLAHRGDGFAGDHLTANCGLDRYLIELAWDDRLQLLRQAPALRLRLGAMRDDAERVDRFSGHQDVDLHQLAFPEADHLVIHRRVAFGARLQLVVVVVDDLAEGHLVIEDYAVAGPVLQVLVRATALLAELHHRPDVGGWNDDRQLHEGLRDGLDHRWLRQQG